MKSNFARLMFATLLVFLTTGVSAIAQQETTLYSFGNSTNAGNPISGMVFDRSGNLYGASLSGAIWKLTPQSNGTWTQSTIANLDANHFNYSESGLAIDSAGNLYGTSLYGGTRLQGTVFELMPQSNGTWKFKILHAFGRGKDGASPNTTLTFDAAGNLYGTTLYGGANNVGVVFKLTPQSNGSWNETVLHSFGSGTDGRTPFGQLVLDAAGNLYGTTQGGGIYSSSGICVGCGTVYELVHQGSTWTEKILYNFGNGTDAAIPQGGVIFDKAGNLYGATTFGGIYTFGTAYELMPQSNGTWKEVLLHQFGATGDGIGPDQNLVFDSAGNLYGTTFGGAEGPGGGTAFELMPQADGTWQEKILWYFTGAGDGANPDCNLILDSAGNLYGTTFDGSTNNAGTAFEITP